MIDGFRDAFIWMLPNWKVPAMFLAWIAVVIVLSSLANHQTRLNKQLNTLKSLGYTTFLVSLTVVIVWTSNGEFSYRGVLIGYTAFLLSAVGDWISYYIYLLNIHPGGVGGWFWSHVALLSKSLNLYASAKFTDTLDHSELKLANMWTNRAVKKEIYG